MASNQSQRHKQVLLQNDVVNCNHASNGAHKLILFFFWNFQFVEGWMDGWMDEMDIVH
jgi:hypothetical protein